MIKIQVQTCSDNEVSKYTSYFSDVIPSVGHTLQIKEQRFRVRSVTWFIPFEYTDDAVNEVHVSADLIVYEYCA